MPKIIWCEHCRDHFEESHYDDAGEHKAGLDFGFLGRLLAIEQETKRLMEWYDGKIGILEYETRRKQLQLLLAQKG